MAAHEKVKREKGMRRDAMRRMWRMLFVDFVYLMVNVALFHDLEGAFLRSMVVCDTPAPHRGASGRWECAKGAIYDGVGACQPEPPGARYWSQSETCASKSIVANRAVTLHAELGVAGHISSIVAIIFLGPLVDSWGRKPIMLLGLLGAFARSVLYMAADAAGNDRTVFALLLSGAIASHLTNAFSTAVNAMVADLSRPDVQGRSAAFAAKGMAQNIAQLCGFVLGYFVLKMHLTSYSGVLSSCAAVSFAAFVLAAVVLKDTASEARTELDPESEAEEDEEYEPLQLEGHAVLSSSDEEEVLARGGVVSCCLEATDQVVGTFVIFWRERFLRHFIGLSLLLALAHPAHHMAHLMLMNQLDYSPEAASLSGVLQPIFGALGALLAASLTYRAGSYVTFAGALLFEGVALAAIGLCGPFPERGDVLFWAGTALMGISVGVSHAVGHALVSVRASDEVQGRLFAFLHIIQLLGSTVGESYYSAYLYDADWEGWAAGMTFFVAAALMFLCVTWVALIYYRVIRRARKLAAFSSFRDEEDTD